jgi:hypothetical protein
VETYEGDGTWSVLHGCLLLFFSSIEALIDRIRWDINDAGSWNAVRYKFPPCMLCVNI